MTAASPLILIVLAGIEHAEPIKKALESGGMNAVLLPSRAEARLFLNTNRPDLVVLGEGLKDGSGLDFVSELNRLLPAVPSILLAPQESPDVYRRALEAGFQGCICLPVRKEAFLALVSQKLEQARLLREVVMLETRRATTSLSQRVDELETLARLGRAITSSLDLEGIFSSVVRAAAELTGAEESVLLLLDQPGGELYLRAAHNFQEPNAMDFRLPVADSLAGSVVQNGAPILISEDVPQRIKTSYLVQSLVYVPLQTSGRVIGVLGVDNRRSRRSFQNRDVKLLEALAESTVIAIQNAQTYNSATLELNRLETLLDRIQDGVIVFDDQQHVLVMNQAVCSILGLAAKPLLNQPLPAVVSHPELRRLAEGWQENPTGRVEVIMPDESIYLARLAPVAGVGHAITIHDITYLKKMDHMKNEFVSTVSHDLRSPLTAILGYVELLERAGPVNEKQKDFIRRVHNSVRSITGLIDDLLNLSKIEAGLENRREVVELTRVIRQSLEGFQQALEDRQIQVQIDLVEAPLPLLSNPVQMRQLVDNLVENALKYTPSGGSIRLRTSAAQEQAIFQVSDTGIGIPAADISYIFEKFYRASNVDTTIAGTGLGLAIVRSVVDANQGRIWVDSTPGKGSTFTVVLPLSKPS